MTSLSLSSLRLYAGDVRVQPPSLNIALSIEAGKSLAARLIPDEPTTESLATETVTPWESAIVDPSAATGVELSGVNSTSGGLTTVG